MKLAKTIWQKMEAIAKLFLVSISVNFLVKKEYILQFLCQLSLQIYELQKNCQKVGATAKNFCSGSHFFAIFLQLMNLQRYWHKNCRIYSFLPKKWIEIETKNNFVLASIFYHIVFAT